MLTRTTSQWTETTMPAGLRRRHRLASGSWARITVRQGGLTLAMANRPGRPIELTTGATQAIPPDVDHDVQPHPPVRFSIDFFSVDRSRQRRHDREPPDGDTSEQGGDPACWAGLLCAECGAVLDGSPHRADCHLDAPGGRPEWPGVPGR
jgi:tellurite resistance-related uncharacterized protein